MTIDLRALPWEVFIADGSTELDCTEARVSLLLQAQPWDQSGWWEMSGTLVLAAGVEGFAENLDRRANPGRLAIGNAIYIDINFGGATGKIRLPVALQITGNCNRPNLDENPVISIPVGSVRSAKNYGNPEGQAGGATFGTFASRDALINAMLGTVGAGTLTDAIPEYPLNYSPQKTDRGSWLELAGKVAAPCNKFLWQANGGAIRASTLTLDGLSPIAHLEVGRNEAEYRYGNATDNPPRTVRVTGTGYQLLPVTETDDIEIVRDAAGQAVGSVRTQTSGSTTYVHSTTETHRLRRGDVLPDLYPGDLLPFDAYRKTTTRIYSLINKALIREELLEERPRIQVLGPSAANPTALMDANRSISHFRYSATEVLRERSTLIEEPDSANPFGALTDAELSTEFWIPRGNGNYSYQRSPINYRSGAQASPPTGNGNGRPPATQYRPSPTTKEELSYQGEATFDTGTPGKIWDINITGGLITSNAQAYDYAYLWGRIRQGRAWPIQWKAQLTAAWLQSFSPVQRLDVTHKGTRTAYLVEGFALSLGPDYAEVGGSAAEIGQVATGGTGTPAPVYKPVATATIQATLSSPSGSIPIEVGASPITIGGSLPDFGGSVAVTLGAWAVAINGSLPSFGGSVAATVAAPVTISGSLPDFGGSVSVALVTASGGGGGGDWGEIGGTLSNQADLQAALDAKADLSILCQFIPAAIQFLVDGSPVNLLIDGCRLMTATRLPGALAFLGDDSPAVLLIGGNKLLIPAP